MPRHPQIRNVEEVEAVDTSHEPTFAATRKRLAANTNSKEIGCSWFSIPPGKRAFPHHSHFNNDEAFYILSGTGVCRIGEDSVIVSAGDYISCPAGNQFAHSISNSGTTELTYLAISTAHATDVLLYPDSQKIAIAAGADMHRGLKSAAFSKMIKDQPSVDYYLDEN